VLQQLRRAEVAQLDLAAVEEHVERLEVTVRDAHHLMQEGHPRDDPREQRADDGVGQRAEGEVDARRRALRVDQPMHRRIAQLHH